MVIKRQNKQISYIDARIQPSLKEAIDAYCEKNIEKLSECATTAIKNYIGIGRTQINNNGIIEGIDEGKTFNLHLRVHQRLKDALMKHCKKSGESQTEAVTNAITLYINF